MDRIVRFDCTHNKGGRASVTLQGGLEVAACLVYDDGDVSKDVVESRGRLIDDSEIDFASKVQRCHHRSW